MQKCGKNIDRFVDYRLKTIHADIFHSEADICTIKNLTGFLVQCKFE